MGGGNRFFPVVVGPGSIGALEDGKAPPHLVFLRGLLGAATDDGALAVAAIEALAGMDEAQRPVYSDLSRARLNASARAAVEHLMLSPSLPRSTASWS